MKTLRAMLPLLLIMLLSGCVPLALNELSVPAAVEIEQETPVASEVGGPEPGPVRRLQQKLRTFRSSGVHPPQVVAAAVAACRLEGHPAPVTAPLDQAVA